VVYGCTRREGVKFNQVMHCLLGRVAANKEYKSRVAGHCLSQGKTLPAPNLIKKKNRIESQIHSAWIIPLGQYIPAG